jgi:DNA repair exonuclease SbcCD ATPase subunit
MRSLKFHLVRAQDILCFGPNGVEVHFNDHGQIIQVVGINLDMPGTDELPASNAAGKSSLQELLSIGLFGRTVKNPTKNKGTQIINTLAVKGEIEVQWDDYRLLRTFKKKKDGGVEAKLQLWKSLNKIWDKQSEVDRLKHNLDEEIQRAIGLSHHAFCNVVIFDDSSEYSFLEADTPTKRQIVENLLDLDQYRGYYDNAKKFLKDNKEKIVALTRDYTHSLEDVAAIERRATMILAQEKSWLAGKEQEITNLKSRIDQKQKALQLTDNGSQLDMWQAAQNQMLSLRDDNIDLEAKRKRIDEVISSVREKVESIRVERATIKELISERNASLQACKTDLARAEKLIDKLKNLEDGASCPYCLGTIHKANHDFVISQSRDEIEKFQRTMAEDVAFIASEQEKYDKKTVSIAAMEDKIREADGKLLSLGSICDAQASIPPTRFATLR